MAGPIFEIPKCEAAKPPPAPDVWGCIVTITVGKGPHSQDFQVYEGLLSHFSSYFRAAMKPEWNSSKTRTIKLPEDKPAVFQAFFNWLFTRKLFTKLIEGNIPLSALDITNIYIFGDARGIPELCNAAADLFVQHYANAWVFPTDCLTYIYENTTTKSSLRRLVVEMAVSSLNFAKMNSRPDHYPKEFLVDVLMNAYSKKRIPGYLTSKHTFLDKIASQMCDHHDHSDPHLR